MEWVDLLSMIPSLGPKYGNLCPHQRFIPPSTLIYPHLHNTTLPPPGKATINSMYGTRVAVLAGDYLFAQSSWFLANLENIEVIKLISQVIADFANGEISQVWKNNVKRTTKNTYFPHFGDALFTHPGHILISSFTLPKPGHVFVQH